ncbi:UDP-N-acetylmuramate--L-alanine ligase [Reichenbachiella versicolor]|uniref:UDP-N-acetylmuramate--L-alanine ligase n=1 Tax=Reichenbachiella versicolor TaxID=1821036 RepID=UPI000D6E0E3F|nr:Mur ligase domain-containing protein [Reichenbachiella versicolor]
MNETSQNIHIIAIGGAVMSSLAIALKEKGNKVTGSDDKIYDPAKSNLEKHGLLPASEGWDADKITNEIDTVILGMHAKADNPELQRAQKLGLNIMSYPEFISSQSRDKHRIVIAGSHGKTTITGIIVHVLNFLGKDTDYLIGAKINGIENTIKLSNAPMIVIEGDEYFTSPLDQTPKFLKYDHHIALISGTEWDHINVYPTLDSYIEQFEMLADQSPKAGSLVFCENDKMALIIGTKDRPDINAIPYKTPDYKVKDGKYLLKGTDGYIDLKVFGKHNMLNIEGARQVLKRISVTDEQFYSAIGSFEGAAKRNTLIKENENSAIYLDFAHAPSKLKATVDSLKEKHPKRKLTACFELHTFSSLNKEFLPHYQGKFKAADEAIVYFNKKSLEEKNYMKELSQEEVKKAFKRKDLIVFTDEQDMASHLKDQDWNNRDLLMMSSGNFNGLNIESLANDLI